MKSGLCGCLTWMLVLAGCGDDSGGDTSDSGADASGTGMDGSGGSSATSTSGPPTSTSAAEGSGGGSSSSASAGSDSSGGSDTGVAVDCAEAPCGAGEVCVVPCCGGAPPQCLPPADNGACPDGTQVVDAGDCAIGCGGDTCCLPTGPCEPDPPYCAPGGNLVCGGDPRVADQCSLDSCFGTLEGSTLACQCA